MLDEKGVQIGTKQSRMTEKKVCGNRKEVLTIPGAEDITSYDIRKYTTKTET